MLRTQTYKNGWRSHQLRGALGDNSDDPGSYTIDPTAGAPPDIVNGPVYMTPSGATTYIPPSAATGGLSPNILTTLFNDATALAVPVVKAATQQAPYYITGPNGQAVLYNPNTGAASGLSSLTSSPGLLLGAALLIGLVLFAKK